MRRTVPRPLAYNEVGAGLAQLCQIPHFPASDQTYSPSPSMAVWPKEDSTPEQLILITVIRCPCA